jgi:hypothetical protein
MRDQRSRLALFVGAVTAFVASLALSYGAIMGVASEGRQQLEKRGRFAVTTLALNGTYAALTSDHELAAQLLESMADPDSALAIIRMGDGSVLAARSSGSAVATIAGLPPVRAKHEIEPLRHPVLGELLLFRRDIVAPAVDEDGSSSGGPRQFVATADVAYRLTDVHPGWWWSLGLALLGCVLGVGLTALGALVGRSSA